MVAVAVLRAALHARLGGGDRRGAPDPRRPRLRHQQLRPRRRQPHPARGEPARLRRRRWSSSSRSCPGFLTLIGTGKFLASSSGPVIFAEPPIRVDPRGAGGLGRLPVAVAPLRRRLDDRASSGRRWAFIGVQLRRGAPVRLHRRGHRAAAVEREVGRRPGAAAPARGPGADARASRGCRRCSRPSSRDWRGSSSGEPGDPALLPPSPTDPAGGNPAGVVLDAAGMDDAAMQADRRRGRVLRDRVPRRTSGSGVVDVRYFSPLAEVPFCGHATIATAVAHAERNGPGAAAHDARPARCPVQTVGRPGRAHGDADERRRRASTDLADDDLAELLAALGWSADDLDPALPPRVAYAGAWHPVIAAATRERLADLDYDFDRLGALMAARDWTTRRARAPRVRHGVPRPQPVPARRRGGGPGDGRGGRRVRRLPARAGPRHSARHGRRSTRASTWAGPSRITVDVFDADSGIGVTGRR